MTKRDGFHPDVWINLACCYFFLGMYPEGDKAAQRGKSFSNVIIHTELCVLSLWCAKYFKTIVCFLR